MLNSKSIILRVYNTMAYNIKSILCPYYGLCYAILSLVYTMAYNTKSIILSLYYTILYYIFWKYFFTWRILFSQSTIFWKFSDCTNKTSFLRNWFSTLWKIFLNVMHVFVLVFAFCLSDESTEFQASQIRADV